MTKEDKLNQFQYSYEQDTVTIVGEAVIGSSGAVSSAKGGGIASVAKITGDGKYTITLSKKFARLLKVDVKSVLATISGVARVQVLQDPATLQADVKSTGEITVQCVDIAGAAVNPASGERLQIEIVVRRSAYGPFDL